MILICLKEHIIVYCFPSDQCQQFRMLINRYKKENQLDNNLKTTPKNNKTSYKIVMLLVVYSFLYTKSTTLQATFPIGADKDFRSFTNS